VSPETGEHLAKAREYLTKARGLLDVLHYNDEAGRAAYLAGFHAAQAYYCEAGGMTITRRSQPTLCDVLNREVDST